MPASALHVLDERARLVQSPEFIESKSWRRLSEREPRVIVKRCAITLQRTDDGACLGIERIAGPIRGKDSVVAPIVDCVDVHAHQSLCSRGVGRVKLTLHGRADRSSLTA
jgi:hypothetical protein